MNTRNPSEPPLGKSCQACIEKKSGEKAGTYEDTRGQIGTHEDILKDTSGSAPSAGGNMVYNVLMQRAKELSWKERLMSAKEIADIVRVSDKTIRRWGADEKIIVYFPETKSTRFDIVNVLEFCGSKRRGRKQKRRTKKVRHETKSRKQRSV